MALADEILGFCSLDRGSVAAATVDCDVGPSTKEKPCVLPTRIGFVEFGWIRVLAPAVGDEAVINVDEVDVAFLRSSLVSRTASQITLLRLLTRSEISLRRPLDR